MSSSIGVPDPGITTRSPRSTSASPTIGSTRRPAPSTRTSTTPGRSPTRSRSGLGITNLPALSMVAFMPGRYHGGERTGSPRSAACGSRRVDPCRPRHQRRTGTARYRDPDARLSRRCRHATIDRAPARGQHPSSPDVVASGHHADGIPAGQRHRVLAGSWRRARAAAVHQPRDWRDLTLERLAPPRTAAGTSTSSYRRPCWPSSRRAAARCTPTWCSRATCLSACAARCGPTR